MTDTVDHTTRAHSDFSASSTKRLLSCPASFDIGKKAAHGPRRSSVYAAEGTAAHEYCEKRIAGEAYPALGDVVTVDGFEITITQDFIDNCMVYVKYVRDLIASGYDVKLEQRVSPNAIFFPDKAPIDLFGTSDVVAYHRGYRHLEIVDLKFGMGVAVEADDNPQFLYYALGVILEHGYDVSEITTTVVQPRIAHEDGPIRSAAYAAVDVLMWGQNVLKPGVLAALKEGAAFATGDHCKFCPGQGTCPELHKQALSIAKSQFGPSPLTPPVPTQLEAWQLADIVSKFDMLDAWMKAVRQEAYNRLVAGQEVPGFKLVQKKAIRKWADGDEDVIVAQLEKAGFDLADITTVKIKSPAQIEKLVGGPSGLKRLNQHIVKESSGTTMVLDTDARPAVSPRPAVSESFLAIAPPKGLTDA